MGSLLIIAGSVVLFYLVLRWDVHDDFKKWLLNKTVQHKKEFIYRVAFLLPCVFGLTIAHSWPWYFSIILSVVMVGFNYWFLFDAWYNRKRNFNIFFNGSGENVRDRSAIDCYLEKIPDWLEATIKIGGGILLIAIYLLTLY